MSQHATPLQHVPNMADLPQTRGRRWRIVALTALLAGCFYAVEHSWQASSLWQEGAARASDKVDLDEIVARGSRTRQVAFGLLGVCGVILCWRHRKSGGAVSPAALLFFAFFALQLVSAVWSIDPMLSAKRGLILAFLATAALGLQRAFTVEELCQAVIVVCGLFLLVGVVAEVRLGVFHPWSSGYRFAGTVHPNTQAIHCALLALGAALLPCRSMRQLLWTVLLVSVATLLLLLTKSRTSLLAFAATVALLVWLRTSGRTRLVLVLGLLLAVSSGLLVMEMSGQRVAERFDDIVLLGRTGKTATLSGRIPLWSALVPYILDRPLLGYGYGAFWSPDRILEMASKTKWQMVHSHNAYIETLLAVGLTGLLTMLSLVMVSLIRHIGLFRASGNRGHAFFATVLSFFLIYSCLEAGFMLPTFASLIWMISMAAAVFVPATDPAWSVAASAWSQRSDGFSSNRSPAF